MGSSPELCLRWHSYETSLLMSVSDMWDAGAMTDVTLSADGRVINAHQVVLSSCSGYFKEALQNVTAAEHPIIVLPFARFDDLQVVIHFMYKGEVNITQQELPGLLKMAEALKVKGLAKLNPSKATGLLQKAYQQNQQLNSKLKIPHIKVEPDVWNTPSISYGEDEEAVEITEIADDSEGNLIVDEDGAGDDTIDDHDLEDALGDDSNLSGSEQSEGKLYFLTSLGQSEEGTERSEKKRRRSREDLLRALSVAWDKERNNGRATIRKTLLPVSCPICYKVLSNAYNLKVHMSIHDGLNHQCSVCGHTSKSRDALRKHLAYRHLIGQSGPVRPRLPSKRRRLTAGAAGDESPPLTVVEDITIPATPSPDLTLMIDSGGEGTESQQS